MLEIPALDINIPIFEIPFSNDMWDVSWLWDQAGWLEGSAYPTMDGNSILTAHVVTADGKNGPFAHLKSLTSEDYVFIANSGFRYIYGVDSINLVKPNDISVFSHEEDTWLTLITCDSYDEKTREYLLRVVVRAQLVAIQEIK
jgi:LPXTG-site transpeptidase (sortase) family protein